MFNVYTEQDYSDLTKTLVGEYKDLDDAIVAAQKAIENKPELRYIVEEATGHFNSWGEMETRVIVESK